MPQRSNPAVVMVAVVALILAAGLGYGFAGYIAGFISLSLEKSEKLTNIHVRCR